MNSRLQQRLLEKGTLFGTHVTMNDPVVSELFGYAGYDYLWLDTEHTAIDYKEILSHICFARQTDTPVIVRVYKNDQNHTKRVLEMGPDGVIFPMINTAEEADIAMKSCMYPPFGVRGFAPRHAVRYGVDDVCEYILKGSLEISRFIQIETETSVRNLPEIARNQYIDGFIFGPCDLSNSVGEHGDVFGAKTTALIEESIATIKKTGKLIGVSIGSTDAEVIARWKRLGINMISSGVDCDYLLREAKRTLTTLATVYGKDA